MLLYQLLFAVTVSIIISLKINLQITPGYDPIRVWGTVKITIYIISDYLFTPWSITHYLQCLYFSVKIFHFTLWTLTNVQNDSLLTHQHNFLYHIEYVHVTTKCIYVWFFGFLYKPIKADLTIISKFLFRNSSNLNLSPIFFFCSLKQ